MRLPRPCPQITLPELSGAYRHPHPRLSRDPPVSSVRRCGGPIPSGRGVSGLAPPAEHLRHHPSLRRSMRAAIAGLLFALSGCQPAAPPNQQALPAPAVIATPAVQRTVQAEAQNADAQLARGLELLRQNNIPQARVDEPKAAAASAHATVAQAQAALNGARLDLGYTQITAPIAGWIGLVAVSVGNLVGPASGVLATIVSKDPIYVQFPITQRDLLNARREIKAKGGDPRQVQVQVRLPDGTLYEPLGHLDFVDVTTDRTTDSVTLRAGFPNPDGVLVDGQYVGVVVKSSIPEWAILIPRMALQVDQQGNYVLIVDAEGRAQVRRVVTGQTQGREVAIIQGLQAGELVIIEGAQAVRPGQAVRAQPPEALGSRGGA
ncbi:efflux RND transporter periplasmic adaptor subunit [Caldichromatium japonicum]|uniref:Efflux RND transporter periplasmic adaptor subunit n=2 Tax=Caldichromatium japonicum TaxID=2699430 RepID=A0A6G7VA35_9GAMM|nr:efflux RND transporter periplasmic adaptor subunit [Caldichromatium japonicum]